MRTDGGGRLAPGGGAAALGDAFDELARDLLEVVACLDRDADLVVVEVAVQQRAEADQFRALRGCGFHFTHTHKSLLVLAMTSNSQWPTMFRPAFAST